MRCPACNSELKNIEYQARSADEAQSSMLRCPNCPLNIDDFKKDRINIHVHLSKRQRKILSTPVIESSSANTTKLLCCRTKLSNMSIDTSNPNPMFATNYIDSNGSMFRHYHDGRWENFAINVKSKTQMAPNVKLFETSMFRLNKDPERQYLMGHYLTVDGKEYTINGDDISLIIEITQDSDIASVIQTMYMSGFAPLRLSDYINQTTLGSLSNLSARAYDKYSVSDYDHEFSTKPDGERLWMTKLGIVWVFSRRLTGHCIVGWKVDSSMIHCNSVYIGPILDIEFIIGFDPILIDILMDLEGKVVSHQRNVSTINALFYDSRDSLPTLHMIHVRNWYSTLKEALEYKDMAKYPTDGIVAIPKHGVDMFKIKDQRSIELQLTDDSKLQTSDGVSLFSIDSNNIYDTGSIIEVRFTVNSVDADIQIVNTFHRPDKQRANDMNAVLGVIESSFKPTDDTNNILRTEIWRWSNALRSTLYDLVRRQIGNKSVVLDIGTGDGQSSDAFASMTECSFILVEPDPFKCKRLITKLGIYRYHRDPRSVINIMPQLRKGLIKYHVLNCKVSEIVNDQPTMDNLKYVVDYCIACFSAHFVIDSLTVMSDMGIKILGCCYFYDGIQPGSSIINEYGLRMLRVSETIAEVKWGTDKAYSEPSVESTNISGSLTRIPATSLIGYPSNEYDGLIRRVCSQVWILRSK
jgi:hypothetical protein